VVNVVFSGKNKNNMSVSTQKLNVFFRFFILTFLSLSFSGLLHAQFDCSMIIDPVSHPSSCYASDGAIQVQAFGQSGSPCNRRIFIFRESQVLANALNSVTLTGLPSGEYLVVADNDCGCPRESRVVILSGGNPTKLTPHTDNGNGYKASDKVNICGGGSLKLGVQNVGMSGLELFGPGGFYDNTPDGASFWILNNLKANQSGVYNIRFTNSKGCVSNAFINVFVGSLNAGAGPDKAGCLGTSHVLTVPASGVGSCIAPCTAGTDALLVLWDLNACNANGQANQVSYEEFTPTYPAIGNCISVTASNVYREFGEHSCARIGEDGVGMCVSSMTSCDPTHYNPANAIKFQVTLEPGATGKLSGLSFREVSPLIWRTTNGATGINNINTKYLIRVYKNDILIFAQDDLQTELDWNTESFDFSSNPDFDITETTTFRFELMGYCVIQRGGNMSGWEVDDIRIFGGCCDTAEIIDDYSVVWSTGDTTKSIVVNPLVTTDYIVTVTDCKNCSIIDTVRVVVYPLPDAVISGNTSICKNKSTVLTASGGISYAWSTGENTQSITVQPEVTTFFTVTVTDENNCTATASVEVTVFPLPIPSISGPDAVCLGNNAVLTASGGLSYLWSDGSVTNQISVSPSATTVYAVTVTDVNGCTATASKLLLVHPLPVASISGENEICIGSDVTLTATGGNSYLWSTGQTSNQIVVSPPVSTTYSVTVTDSNGCTATTAKSVVVNALPQVNITGQLSLCKGAASVLTASGGTEYVWSTGAITASITITPGISTGYGVTVTDSKGCVQSASVFVTVHQLPAVTVQGPPSICEGDQVVLTASGGITYQWNNGQTTAQITVAPSVYTVYTVTVTDTNGCTASGSKGVDVSPKPAVIISGGEEICVGENVQLQALVSGNTNCPDDCKDELMVLWNLDNCNAEGFINQNSYSEFLPLIISQTQFRNVTASVVFKDSGDHSCTPDGTGGAGICVASSISCDPFVVSPVNLLKFRITVDPEYYGNIARLSFREQSPLNWITTNGSTGVNNVNTKYLIRVLKNGTEIFYQDNRDTELTWNTEIIDFSGNPDFRVDQTTVFEFQMAGYCVDDRGGISGWEVDDIRIFGGACIPSQQSGNVSYLWSTGETTQTITVNPLSTTTYSVTVTDCNNCIAVSSTTVIVNELPQAQVTGLSEICEGNSTTITASGGVTYIWNNGQTTAAISISPDVSSTYSVTVTDAKGCSSVVTKLITVNSLPQPFISGNAQLCIGESSILTVSGGSSVLWSNGSIERTISVQPLINTTYSVTVTDQNGCTASTAIVVIVNPLPEVNISGNQEICAGQNAQITATGGNVYVWSTGDVAPSITVSPSTTSTYRVTVVDGNGCQNTGAFTVTVNPLPVVSISGPGNICIGNSATLTVSGGSAYLWSTGSSSASVTVSPTSTTTYSVTVTDSKGCSAVASISVAVNTLPPAAITGPTSVCKGQSVELTASGGVQYLWNNGSTTTSISVSPTENTSFSVTVTDQNGCTAVANTLVSVLPDISVHITGGGPICVGESSTLTASGGGSYVWSTGATTASITVSPQTTTTYSVTVTGTSGCSGTASTTVVVHPNPEVQITGKTEICEGECTTLTASGGVSYSWEGGASGGYQCNGSFFVGGLQNGSPQSLYRYSGGSLVEIGPLGTNWVNGIGYYCGSNNVPMLYGMRMPGTDPLNAIRANFTIIDPQTGSATVLNDIPLPPNPYGLTGISGIFNFVADVTADGYYVFPAAAALINPFTFEITSYTIYLGKIDLNNHGNGTNVTYMVINPDESCQAYLDACVEAFRVFAFDPSTGEPSGGIQDWAVSPDGTELYSFFGIENGLFRLNLSDLSAGCVEGPTENGIYTGMTGGQTDEFGGIYFEGGELYGWQVDRGRLFSINRTTGVLTLLDSSLPRDYRGDNAGCYNCGGGNPTTDTAEIEVCPDETTTYTVTVTDANGCTGTKSVTVIVNKSISVSITGGGPICVGESSTLTASGGGSYVWSTGATTASITVSPQTTTTYSVTVTGTSGCSGTASTTVVVNPNPEVQITGKTEICEGECTTLTASGGVSYSWEGGASGGYQCNGSFFVGGLQNGSPQSLYRYSGGSLVEIGPLGTNWVNGIGYYCGRNNVPMLYGMRMPGTDPLNAIRANFTIIDPQTGSATVLDEIPQPSNPYGTLGVTGIFNFVADISSDGTYYFPAAAVLINPLTFQIIDYTIYLGKINVNDHGNGQNVSYEIVSVLPNCKTYMDACIAAFQTFALNPSGQEPSGGIQDWAFGPDGKTLFSFFGIENGLFRLDIENRTISCMGGPGENTPFTGMTGGQTDEFGGIYFEGGEMYGWQVDRGRLYRINTETGGLSLLDSNLPRDYRGDNAGCYNCGGGNPDNDTAEIEVCPSETTTYTVTVTDANGCTATKSVTVTVGKRPQITIVGGGPICVGGSVTLTAGGGTSYIWSNGMTGASVTVSPVVTTTYVVTVSSAGGCTSTASRTVTVNPLPVPQVVGDREICVGETAFVGVLGGVSQVWSTGSTGVSIAVSPLVTTTYGVTITDINGCTAATNVVVTVLNNLNVNITGGGPICVGESSILTASGGGSYVWSTGATTASITVSPQTTTTYSVTVTGTSGCSGTASTTVVVNPNPEVQITGKTEICEGECTTLTASGGVSYSWEGGASGGYQCNGSFFVGGLQNGSPQSLYRYSGGSLVEIGPLGTNWVNGIGYYCGSNNVPMLYGMRMPGTDPLNAIRANFTIIDPQTGSATVLNDIPLPPNPYGLTGISGIFNFVADVTADGYYVFPAAAALINPFTFEITSYTIYLGKIDLNNHGNGTNVTYMVINPDESCQAYLDACVEAFRVFAFDPSTGEPSGGIQDWAVSPDGTELYSFFGIENGLFRLNLSDLSAGCVEGPTENGIYTGMTGGQTDEFGGIYFEGGELYGWQVDRGRLFSINRTTGVLTLLDSSLPRDYRGDNAGCYNCGGGNPTTDTAEIEVCPDETTTYTVTVTDANGCTGTKSVTVIVNKSISVSITGGGPICVGESSTLTASGGGSYVWSTGATTASITVSPQTTTTYSVTVTGTSGCSGTASTTVVVHPNPEVQITGKTEICEGECTTLTASGGVSYSWEGGASGGYQCNGSFFVGGLQNGSPQSLYRYSGGSLVEIGPLGTNWVNGIGYYCGSNNVPMLYGMRMPGTDPLNAIRANFTIIDPRTGSATVLNDIPLPPNPYGLTGISGIFNFVADVTADGYYVFPAAAALINPFTFEITSYTIYLGKIDLNNHGNGSNVTYTAINPDESCQAYLDACVEAFRVFAFDPSTGEPSGGIQDWAISPDGKELYSFFGIENGLFRLNLSDLSAGCVEGPTENGIYTGMTGGQTDEFGGIYFEGGELYGWQVDRGRLFSINRTTGVLTLLDSSLPRDYRGDNAGCYNCGGGNPTTDTAEIEVCPDETTTYTVTVTDANGCTGTKSVTVIVNKSISVSITGGGPICVGESITLTASGGGSYVWSTGATTASITVSPQTTTTYSVTVTGTSGCSGTASTTVVVHPNPEVQITGKTEICEGECTTLTASGGVSYSWEGGASGGYQCNGSFFVGGLQNGSPQSLYRYSGGSLVEIGPLGTNWVNGIGYYCGSNNVPMLYGMRMPGTDPLNAIRANFTIIDPQTGSATVLDEIPQPSNPYGTLGVTGIFNFVADISSDGTYYFPAAAVLINPLTFQIIDYTIYLGKINVNDHGNGQNVSYEIVSVLPNCKTYMDACIAAFQTFALNPAGQEPSGGIQDWAFGPDGKTLFSFFGIENGLFRLDIENRTISCMGGPGENTPFTGMTGGQTDEFGGIYFEGGEMYGWQVDRGRLYRINTETGGLSLLDSNLPRDYRGDNAGCYNCGGGNPDNDTAEIEVCPSETTTYTVTVTDANGCTATKSVTVTVGKRPQITIVGGGPICVGGSVTLTAGGGTSYIWSNGMTGASVTVSPVVTTTYVVTVSSAGGCTSTASRTVTVNPLPVPQVVGDREICVGETAFVGVLGGVSQVWSTGSTGVSIAVSPLVTTTYGVTITDIKGCTAATDVVVTVYPLPEVMISGDNNICAGETATLTATGGNQYIWSTGQTTASITVNPAASTVYNVTVTGENGCSAIKSITVVVNSRPAASVFGNNAICEGQSLTLLASGGSVYNWSSGQSTASINVTPIISTTYTVTVTGQNGCTGTSQFSVAVNPKPEVFINGNDRICKGDRAIIVASGLNVSHCQDVCDVTAEQVLAHWDLEACDAVPNLGTHLNYNELIASVNKANCIAVSAGNVHRNSGPHSCNPGVSGGIGMCFGSQNTCNPSKLDYNLALRFVITLDPLSNGEITGLQFYEQSPMVYEWIGGQAGPNDIAQKYLLRVSKNGTIIYYQDEIQTSRTWSLASFNFKSNPNFSTTTVADFLFELIPYCRMGNGALESVWDIDEIKVLGGCCDGQTKEITSYQWSTGATDPSLVVFPNESTSYTVTVTDCFGCTNTAIFDVDVNCLEADLGPDIQITLGQSVILTPAVTGKSKCKQECEIPSELLMQWNMDACNQSNNTEALNFGEFTSAIISDGSCTQLRASNLVKPLGSHGCAPGINENGSSISISASQGCNFGETSSQDALRFTVTFEPDDTGVLSGLSVQHRSPSIVTLPNGSQTINNSTTKMGLRVYKGSQLIYSASDRNVSEMWTESNFDFSVVSQFRVQEQTSFTFEIIGYCIDNSGGAQSVWHLDNLRLFGGCCTVDESAPNDITYKWSTGETTPTITVAPSVSSFYRVTVTDCRECVDTDNISVLVTQNKDVVVFPNPAKDVINLVSRQKLDPYMKVRLISTDGKEIASSSNLRYTMQGEYTCMIELPSHIPQGVILVETDGFDVVSTFKVLIINK
jgi:hypothetical protein